MRKHKSKLIALTVILTILAGAWFYGGSLNTEVEAVSDATQSTSLIDALGQLPKSAIVPLSLAEFPNTETEEQEAIEALQADEEETATEMELSSTEEEDPEPSPPPTEASVPASTPVAEPPAQAASSPPPNDGTFTVTLSVRADTILHNMHLLDTAKHDLVPASGVIFPATQVTVTAGESVFDVLQREMRRVGIHMASRFTPLYSSAYVEAINNLYEFDVGPLSGWMYRVNGWFPNFGASLYELNPGDVIEWLYTVDLGRDIGGGF